MSRRLVCHVDGGARGNPGPAAIGVVFYEHDPRDSGPRESGPRASTEPLLAWGARLGRATNNVAEYQAVLAALDRALQLGATDLIVRSDSQLLVRQLNGQYKVRQPHLQVLCERVRRLAAGFRSVKFEHVRREDNREPDRLVNQALDCAQGCAKA